jgi:uncharacterized repeat protein (TIGR01451 family)
MIRKTCETRAFESRHVRGKHRPRAYRTLLALGLACFVVAVPRTFAQSPGGVAGASFWVKGNQGVQTNGSNQVEQWTDQSGSANTTTQLRAAHPAHTDPIAASNDILLAPSSINFNPSVDFSGALGKSLKGNAASNWTTGPLTIFAVAVREGTLSGLTALWDAHSNWTAGSTNNAGAGLYADNNAYRLDGAGCSAAPTTSPTTVPRVVRGTYVTGTNALGGSTWIDGGQEGTGTSCANVASTFFEVGGRTAGTASLDGRIFNGKIAEVVVYKSDLASADDARVESYLAIKYGITLKATGGGPRDYVTSSGTTIWSGVANATYHTAVAGIAADSAAALDQRASQSIAAGDQVAFAAGAFDFSGTVTAQSPAATIGDQSALVWGHNNQGTTFSAPITDPIAVDAGVLSRMSRVWRTQVTGAGLPAQVSIRIPATLVETGNAGLQDPVLLISTAADFSTVTRRPVVLSKTGSFYYATFTTFTANEYFTIANAVSQDLSVTKAPPASIVAGALAVWTITVTNQGGAASHDVVVSDTLPAALTFISGTPGCSAAGQNVTCALGSIGGGQSVPVTLTVRVAPELPAGSVISNTATVSALTIDENASNNSATAVAPASGTSADLSTTKSALESAITPGNTFTYRIRVTNNGPSTAVNVRATDTLPAPLAFVSSPSGCSAIGQNVSCGPAATLAPGDGATFDIIVRLDPAYTGNGGDIANVATASTDTPDPNPGNDSNPPAPPPSVSAPESDLQIVKHVSPAAVAPGESFSYTLQVGNNGPSNAANVQVTDTLPPQTTFVSSPSGCTAAGQLVTCPSIATLNVGATAPIELVVQLNPGYAGDGGDVLNSATVTSSTADPALPNNTNPAGAPPVGPAGADVTLVKTVSGGVVAPGQTFTYNLLASNQGPSTATNVVVTDPLPAPFAFISSPDGCTAAGQDVACPAIPTLNPGESATFRLVARLDPAYDGDGSDLDNRASIQATTVDPVPGNNTTPPVRPSLGPSSADVSITKAVIGSAISPGVTFTYRLVVTNAGPSVAQAVTATDTLPGPIHFLSSPHACTAAAQVITCSQALLGPGAVATFDLLVQLDGQYVGNGSDLDNVATVGSSTPDPTSTNNTTAPIPAPPIAAGSADLTIDKTGPVGAVPAGGEITYTLVVTNQGPHAATNVEVDDPTPAGLTFVSTSGDCGTAFPCALGTIAPGLAKTITVRYAVPTGLTAITNTATVSSSEADPTPSNNSATVRTPAEAKTYYFGEGATGAFFDFDLLLANPNPVAAPVTLNFYRGDGVTITETRTVAAQSRLTVPVESIPGLEQTSAAVQVVSDSGLPLAVERSMFWDSTFYGGHTGTAVTSPARKWYFAEGFEGYFSTFVLLENPGAIAAETTITFLRETEAPFVKQVVVPPFTRVTIDALDDSAELFARGFGIVVDSTQPVVAERSMYFGSTETRLWSGGHSSAGVTEPTWRWFLPEGATGGFFDLWILLSNPQSVDAHVTIDYQLQDGSVASVPKVVPAHRRLTINVELEPDARLHNASVSARVTSDVPIVAERSMYWGTKPGANPWSEGHNSFGMTQSALRWSVAEGRVGGPLNFQTYLLLSNPQDAAAEVTITYLRENGAPPVTKTYTVPPTTRFNLDVNSAVPEMHDEAFGALIEVTNGVTIAVERSMYWDANGVFWTAGTNAPGTRLP